MHLGSRVTCLVLLLMHVHTWLGMARPLRPAGGRVANLCRTCSGSYITLCKVGGDV